MVIRKLTPALAEDYLHFFDTTPHDDQVPEHTCYCVCWCQDDQRTLDLSRREIRRAKAQEYILAGKLQGYLAYEGTRIIGWCNANNRSDCLHCIGWTYVLKQINELPAPPDERVKSIFCFTIAPDKQRQGVARSLLRAVCEDARQDGYDAVEAYPHIDTENPLRQFMGFRALYESEGFVITAQTDKKYVMRKALYGNAKEA